LRLLPGASLEGRAFFGNQQLAGSLALARGAFYVERIETLLPLSGGANFEAGASFGNLQLAGSLP
jgi:hypothetical protein